MTSSVAEDHPISIDHSRRLVNEMIDYIFDKRKGTCDISSSSCSSLKLQTSEHSYDKRLKYWKDSLRQRKNMSSKILQQTKKNESEILYNRLSSVDERDKQTVKRLIDYAKRMMPTKLITKQPLVLKAKCNTDICKSIVELQETLPKSERCQNVKIEIIGLPKVTQKELLGKSKCQDCKKPFSWLKSKYLEKRIEDMREDIERVVEYYPDIENLQIVGESIIKKRLDRYNSDIKIMSCEEICHISTDTIIDGTLSQVEPHIEIPAEVVDYGFKINDQVILLANKRSARNFKTTINCVCFPFQTELKKIFTLHNIGRKALTYEWVQYPFYKKNSALLKSLDNDFLFDSSPFRLCSGEVRDILVVFQPRQVNIVKCKWILKVKPAFFCRKLDGIVIRICGVCLAPPEYEQKLDKIQAAVIEKSNIKMMRKLTTELSAFIPDLHNFKTTCPYQRCLNEMELFEKLNQGFQCERYNDLEFLKDLYKRIKKPREKVWDFKLDTLKDMLFNVPQAESRVLYFNELLGILECMKGKTIDLETRIIHNPERERSCFLYIRGIICSAIDEWADLIIKLEESFYQTTLHVINKELEKHQIQSKENKTTEYEDILAILQDNARKRDYILKKRVRKLKPYRDSLYFQTYTIMCDFVENIVNIIESIDLI